jgi:hypothetical protein
METLPSLNANRTASVVDRYMHNFGKVGRMITENAKTFVSKEFLETLERYGKTHEKSTPFLTLKTPTEDLYIGGICLSNK